MTSNSILNSINAQKAEERSRGSSANRLTNKYYDRVQIRALLANLELVGKIGPAGPPGPPGADGADGVDALLEPARASTGTLQTTPPKPPTLLPSNLFNNPLFLGAARGINTETYLPGPAASCPNVAAGRTTQYTQFMMLETKVELPSGGTQIVYIPAYY